MKKIFLLSLCAMILLLSGCFKFTPQAEFEAQQKKAAAGVTDTKVEVTDSLSLGEETQVKNDSNSVKEDSKAEVKKEESPAEKKEEQKPAAEQTETPEQKVAPDEPKAEPVPEPVSETQSQIESESEVHAAAQTSNQPMAAVTIIPLDDIWKAAEFLNDYRHSYEVNYPDSLRFSSGADTEEFNGSMLMNDDREIVVEIRDYELKGFSAEDIFKNVIAASTSAGWEILSSSYKLRQVASPALELRGDDGALRYLIKLPNGVVAITFKKAIVADTAFIKSVLWSLVAAK